MKGSPDRPAADVDVPTTGVRRPSDRWLGAAEGLTERESEVLVLCARGLRNQEIADALFLNIETVKSHLKHVYSRLGIRNRAQAAAFVVQAGGDPIEPGARPLRPTEDDRPLAELLGLDADALARRRRLLGLGPDQRAVLVGRAALLRPELRGAIAGLLDRWQHADSTQRYARDEVMLARLSAHQHRYLENLLAGEHGTEQVDAMLRVGAAHHRIGLEPQWYVASLAHLLCALVAPLCRALPPDEATDAVAALVAALFFDASLVLDAYELSVAHEVSTGRTELAAAADGAEAAPEGGGGEPAGPSSTSARPLTRLRLTAHDATQRRAVLGIDEAVLAELHAVGADPRLPAAVEGALGEFYALIARDEALAPLVPPEVERRLLVEVGRYWHDLVHSDLDESHAAACMRVGMVHEQLGVEPQHYLAGLARQLLGLLRRLPLRHPGDTEGAGRWDALLRAALHDATFALDAYLDARAARLQQGAEYAGHIVASLGTGVAVVDARNRMEYANEQLLGIAGVPAGVLHRMRVDDALPVPELPGLLEDARRSPLGRASALTQHGGNLLRVTAMHLHRAMTGRDGVVAVVLDDLSEVLRTADELGYQQRTLDQVLDATRAVVWEVSLPSLTMLAVSPSITALTGRQPYELLGRARWLELIHPSDQDDVITACRAVQAGGTADVRHRLRDATGAHRWADTRLAHSAGDDGVARVGAVSVVSSAVER